MWSESREPKVAANLERRGLGQQRYRRRRERAVAESLWSVIGKARKLSVKTIGEMTGVARATLYSWKPIDRSGDEFVGLSCSEDSIARGDGNRSDCADPGSQAAVV